jgi:hypothetical protein
MIVPSPRRALLLAVATLGLMAAPIFADKPAEPAWSVVDRQGERIGDHRWSSRREAGDLIVREEASLLFRGREIFWKSEVILDPATFAPRRATLETSVLAGRLMEAEVIFSGDTCRVSGHLFRERDGDLLDEPKAFEAVEKLQPGQKIVFHSTLREIGPSLAAWPNQPVEIVFVEFPKDLNEPLKFQRDYTLERQEAPDRSFMVRTLSSGGSEVMRVEFDGFGSCVAQTFDKFSYRPADEAEAQEP